MKPLTQANRHAVFNICLYLLPKGTPPANGAGFGEILADLGKTDQQDWKDSHRRQLTILRGALNQWPQLAGAVIGHQVYSDRGLAACTFSQSGEPVSVIFRGTGKGEWLDNGRGLSGIPEANTYHTFRPERRERILQDQATDSQVEALNWFNRLGEQEGWRPGSILLSGHSKGGNKAQFIAIHSDLPALCFSFDGQGFSPEALESFRRKIPSYEERRKRIFSISADNDYINVLGKRLMPEENIFYLQGVAPRPSGQHALEAILENNGALRAPTEQGPLSRYLERVSDGLMDLPPHTRKYATQAVMGLCQRFIGNTPALNGDSVSPETMVTGLTLALGLLFFPGNS